MQAITWEQWLKLTPLERDILRDNSDLCEQLIGLEGWRVEVIDRHGERRRFIVGKSTGWKPIHLEIARRNCHGGGAVTGAPFQVIRRLYKTR